MPTCEEQLRHTRMSADVFALAEDGSCIFDIQRITRSADRHFHRVSKSEFLNLVPLQPFIQPLPLSKGPTMKLISSVVLLASSVSAFVPGATFHRTTTTTALHMSRVLTSQTGKSSLDPLVIQRYDNLPYPKDTILAEYVWVDAVGNLRSKTRTLPASKVSVRHSLHYIFIVG